MKRYIVRDENGRDVIAFDHAIDAVMSARFSEPTPRAWTVIDTEAA